MRMMRTRTIAVEVRDPVSLRSSAALRRTRDDAWILSSLPGWRQDETQTPPRGGSGAIPRCLTASLPS